MSDSSKVGERSVEQSLWARLGHLIAPLSIVAATAVVLTDGDVTTARKVGLAALAVALLVWHTLMVYRLRYWQLRSAAFGATMLIATALWLPLLVTHPAYEVTLLGAYAVAACPFLARAALSVGGLTLVLLLALAVSGRLGLPGFAGVVLTGLAVVVLHGLVSRIHHQNITQRELISRLRTAQDELARHEREAGVRSERERLARDIHDSLAQGFASIVMLLEAADARLAPEAVDVRARIDQARQAARDNLAEVRRVVWALHPGPLEHGALAGALAVLVQTSRSSSGSDTELRIDGDPLPLAPPQEAALFRAAQEALANAAKHANATRVVCTLTYLEDEAILDINDNGRGFAPEDISPDAHGGWGLAGLRERVIGVGGSLHIDSTPGGGTNLTIAIPASSGAGDQSAAGADAPP